MLASRFQTQDTSEDTGQNRDRDASIASLQKKTAEKTQQKPPKNKAASL